MTGMKSLFEAYREKPYRNIFFALVILTAVDALAPNYAARGQFADLMLAAVLSIIAGEEIACAGADDILDVCEGVGFRIALDSTAGAKIDGDTKARAAGEAVAIVDHIHAEAAI